MNIIDTINMRYTLDLVFIICINDTDFIAVFYPDEYSLMGLEKRKQFSIHSEDYDVAIYDIRKYFDLLLAEDPDALATLFLEDIILTTNGGLKLRELRGDFLSKKCYFSYSGHATLLIHKFQESQFKGDYLKHAAHLIQLLDRGRNLLLNAIMGVERLSLYKEIYNGKFTKLELQKMIDAGMKGLNAAFKVTKLPDTINREYLRKQLFDILSKHFVLIFA